MDSAMALQFRDGRNSPESETKIPPHVIRNVQIRGTFSGRVLSAASFVSCLGIPLTALGKARRSRRLDQGQTRFHREEIELTNAGGPGRRVHAIARLYWCNKQIARLDQREPRQQTRHGSENAMPSKPSASLAAALRLGAIARHATSAWMKSPCARSAAESWDRAKNCSSTKTGCSTFRTSSIRDPGRLGLFELDFSPGRRQATGLKITVTAS